LVSGDLKKGLMAGLGAYGGAGLAGSVLGAGAGAAQNAAMANLGADTAAASMGAQTAGQLGAGFEAQMAQQGIGSVAAPAAGYEAFAPSASNFGAFGEAPIQAAQAVQNVAPQTVTAMPTQAALANQAAANATTDYLKSGFVDQMKGGLGAIANDPSKFMTGQNLKYGVAAAAPAMMAPQQQAEYKPDAEQHVYSFDPGRVQNPEAGSTPSSERRYFNPVYTRMADGGPVSQMSARNEQLTLLANGGQQFAEGGITDLGGYSDGGRMLRGPGDGVSDSIPATINGKQPARLADGEFVVPARIVSELGNGSSEAGARKLYAMMDRIQKARAKTVGKDKVAKDSKAEKMLPA
jgi:hypothetical protein